MSPPTPFPTAIASAARLAADWSDTVDAELGRPGPDVAFAALRSVLAELGRTLPPAARAPLSDALPSLLRGALHAPSVGTAGGMRRIAGATRHAVRSQEAVRAVCGALASHLPADVWRGVRAAVPSAWAELLAVPAHPV